MTNRGIPEEAQIIKPQKISDKWRKASVAYRYFSRDWAECCDYSEEAAWEMYLFESTGLPKISYAVPRSNGKFNGFAVGKHWFDVTFSAWRQDLQQGLLTKGELYSDEDIPMEVREWLRPQLQAIPVGRHVLTRGLS